MGNTIGRRKSNWVGKNRRPECGHGCMEWRLVTHGVWRSWGLSPDLGAKGGGLPSSIFSFSPGRPCFVYSSEEIGESLLAPRAGQEGGGEKRLQFPLNWEGTGGIPPGDHVCPYSNSLGGRALVLGVAWGSGPFFVRIWGPKIHLAGCCQHEVCASQTLVVPPCAQPAWPLWHGSRPLAGACRVSRDNMSILPVTLISK